MYQVDKIYIDGANPSKSLKLQIGEDADYNRVIARYRAEIVQTALEMNKKLFNMALIVLQLFFILKISLLLQVVELFFIFRNS
jgi:hypothetical protein